MRETILICDTCGKRDVSSDSEFSIYSRGDAYEEDSVISFVICDSCLRVGFNRYIKTSKTDLDDLMKLLELKKFIK